VEFSIKRISQKRKASFKDIDHEAAYFCRHLNIEVSSATEISAILTDIENSLNKSAEDALNRAIVTVDAIDEAKDKSGIIRIGWCGEEDCDDQICKFLDLNMLGTPIKDEGYSGNCGQCGKPTNVVAYYAKSY